MVAAEVAGGQVVVQGKAQGEGEETWNRTDPWALCKMKCKMCSFKNDEDPQESSCKRGVLWDILAPCGTQIHPWTHHAGQDSAWH